MNQKLMLVAMMAALYGCGVRSVNVNIPMGLEVYGPIYRDVYVNKDMQWSVCSGRVTIMNKSGVYLEVGRGLLPQNTSIAAGVPYEHIVVNGYDRYGEWVGWAERTFLCNKKDPEVWSIHNYTLWWDHQ